MAVKKAAKEAKAAEATNSFEYVGREWYAMNRHVWSPFHAYTTLRRLENDIFPRIGNRPIGEINPPEVLAVLRKVEARGVKRTPPQDKKRSAARSSDTRATAARKETRRRTSKGPFAPTRKHIWRPSPTPRKSAAAPGDRRLRRLDDCPVCHADGAVGVREAGRAAPHGVVGA